MVDVLPYLVKYEYVLLSLISNHDIVGVGMVPMPPLISIHAHLHTSLPSLLISIHTLTPHSLLPSSQYTPSHLTPFSPHLNTHPHQGLIQDLERGCGWLWSYKNSHMKHQQFRSWGRSFSCCDMVVAHHDIRVRVYIISLVIVLHGFYCVLLF